MVGIRIRYIIQYKPKLSQKCPKFDKNGPKVRQNG